MMNRRNGIIFTIFGVITLVMAAGASSAYAQSTAEFSGTWNTVTSKGKKLVLTLKSVDRRTNVTGVYGRNGLSARYRSQDDPVTAFVKVSATSGESALQNASSITGTVNGNVLRFRWSEDGGRGAGRFTMSSDGDSFEGTFSMTDNPDDTSGGTWSGTRAPTFHGVWQTTVGGKLQFPQLLLQQGGNQVMGQLSVSQPELGLIRDGIIDGSTLRFKIFRANRMPGRPDEYVGVGEFVMDRGSKSFTGTILGTSVSGTRLGR
ncbi:MAG TPA: hypothetical protein VGO43_12235 [Pyrinomonadaceae bacterium]|jgi:hypothetical protein|nr:hypothetical protein [Pyrinomonadaceae bacterium]